MGEGGGWDTIINLLVTSAKIGKSGSGKRLAGSMICSDMSNKNDSVLASILSRN